MGLQSYRKLCERFNQYIYRDEFISKNPYEQTAPEGLHGRYFDRCGLKLVPSDIMACGGHSFHRDTCRVTRHLESHLEV